MSELIHWFIRVSSFFRKEVVEIIRQPRLLLTLILGPFLILFLFGIGYRNEPRAVTALFVAEPDSQIVASIEEYATTLGDQLVFAGVVQDQEDAINRLYEGDVDLVVIVPPNPEEDIRNDQPATFYLYHNEIDPSQEAYLQSLGQIYIDEVNRRVLAQTVFQAQTESGQVKEDVQAARQNARAMREALEARDLDRARERQDDLEISLGNLAGNLGARAALADAIQQEAGTGPASSSVGMLAGLAAMRQRDTVSGEITQEQNSYEEEIQELNQTEQELAEIEQTLDEFDRVSPDTMVRPFRSEVATIAPNTTSLPMNFYAPAVIALLLQHIAVTFGALSIVRERLSGTIELFRVSPISSGEALLGKYLSYLVFGLILGGILLALLVFVLRVPLLGTWYNFVLTVLALLFTSLGLGFLISLIANNESHAVQLAMITLLVSVFFSGLFLDLRYLWTPVQVLSWLTPATYGTVMLQNIMLRGYNIELLYITGLIILGFTFFMISWLLFTRQMRVD